MMLDSRTLLEIMPYAGARAETYAPLLWATAQKFEIAPPKRLAAFLAQLAHESGELRYTREIASGSAYENRKDLGNVHPGDGMRYKGRGLIQITGRNNYRMAGVACGMDYEHFPELMEQPEHACIVSGWYWSAHGLNMLADHDDFLTITKRINGGTNGLADRQAYWERAKKALNV